MSLVAFCFMGGGGIGTAIGGKIIVSYGYAYFFGIYGVFVFALLAVARFAIGGAPSWAVIRPAPEMKLEV
jgi:hypothetical protein